MKRKKTPRPAPDVVTNDPAPLLMDRVENVERAAPDDPPPPSLSLLEQVKDIDLWPGIAARLPHA